MNDNNDNKAVQFYDHLIDVLRKEGLAYEDKIMIGGDLNWRINPLLDKQLWDTGIKEESCWTPWRNTVKQLLICMTFGELEIRT